MDPAAASPTSYPPGKHPNQVARHLQPGHKLPSPAQRAAIEAEQARAVAEDIAASMRRPPTATQRIAIERLARLVIDARRMRRSGRHSRTALLEVERAILSGTRQLGLTGLDPRPPEKERREMRANTSNRAVQAHVARRKAEHAPTPETPQSSPWIDFPPEGDE